MHTAIVELPVVEAHFLRGLASLLGHTGHCLAVAFAGLHLFKYYLCHLELAVEVVVKLLADEIADILCDRRAVGLHVARPQTSLRLALEHRIDNIHCHCRNHTRAYVGVLEIASEIILHRPAHSLFESCQMRASLGGMLAVDKAVVLLAVLVYMCYGHFDIRTLEVDDRVERLLRQVFF